MTIPRGIAVLVYTTGGVLALAIAKGVVVSGLDTLPPVKVLVFAASALGAIAALLDWALLRDWPKKGPAVARNSPAVPSPAPAPRRDPAVERGRLHPIVFREICPPPAAAGLSFYGGVPVGPADLPWPRVRNKPGAAPLSFIEGNPLASCAVSESSLRTAQLCAG